ncbi:MAG TPA: LodA/GoxA family CTQ-dependent oxidase, partial [Longimicrobium sp.]
MNAIPLGEPVEPRPAQWKPGVDYPPGKNTVVRAAIHPAIGVARVGNSDEFFVGPEVVDPIPAPPGFYRDGAGALKRQAALFRIYGYNSAGDVVGELTPDTADIRWTAHVANRKADWYQWQVAMDIPEAATVKLPPRNATVTGADRAALGIDGGSVTIAGKNTEGAAYRFDGSFQGTPVYLGELRTDEAGRLLFLGGLGVSASPAGTPIYNDNDENSFINADGWYDDTSDGPVTAEVFVGGRSIPVDPAWVLTAPPNYAPGVLGVRTLYDLLVDVNVSAGWASQPTEISFRRDVYPILRRLSGLQWVNRGYATQFGDAGPHPFEDPEYLAKLARDPNAGGFDLYGEPRRQVLNSFRDPAGTDNNQLPWPWLYGDAMSVKPLADTPRQNATVSLTQYRTLQAWAAGKFTADWESGADDPRDFALVPLADQPATLDRAALEHCLADAFHPGCEVTWPTRHASMYMSPFRVLHRPAGVPEPDYGPVLTQEIALSPDGPLHAQGPGDLTRWMGLPWQADTAFCRSGYDTSYDPYVPSFWPARVPNQVLSADGYAAALDTAATREERLAAFTNRAQWTRPLVRDTAAAMEQMVHIFGEMGLVEVREGACDDPELPRVMMVESVGPNFP